MQSIWKRFHDGYSSRGSCAALLSVLIILLFAATASVAQTPPIVVSQTTWTTAFLGGGALSGGNPSGVSWGANSMGVIVASDTYGNAILQFTGPGYAVTSAGTVTNAGAVAIDSNGFLYVSTQYGNNIVKVAMNATTGLYNITADPGGKTFTATSVPVCDGVVADDTTAGECLIKPLTTDLGYFAVESFAFDASNDLFIATNAAGSPTTPPAWSIYECTAKCLYAPATGSPAAPVLVYNEPTAANQVWIGGMAIDRWGNLFYTDSAIQNAGNQESDSSDLQELLATTTKNTGFGGATTGFAAAPVTVVTFTDATPAKYDDEIAAVFANLTTGTIYIGLVNSGIYAVPNSSTGANAAGLYAISNQGTKLLMQDAYDNFFIVGNTTAINSAGADTLGYISVLGPEFTSKQTTADLLVADSSEPCSPTLTFAFGSPDFTEVEGTCASSSLGKFSFVPVTVTYAPSASVPIVPFTVTDTTSGATTTLTAQASTITGLDQQTWEQPFTNGGAWGSDSAGGTSGAINTMGVVVIGNSYGNGIQVFTAGGSVVTNIGTTAAKATGVAVSGAGGTAIDSQNYLYASNEYGDQIIKFPMNADGTYGSAAFTTTTGLPTCAGDGQTPDTAGACQIEPGSATLSFGVAALTFDSTGNLFITTSDEAQSTTLTNQPFSILECGPTCLYGAKPTAPVVLWSEPAADPAGDQYYIGSIAVDASENVFFTDTYIRGNGTEYNTQSNVKELPYDAKTSAYAAAPTVLQTLVPTCATATCSYNNEIDSVAVVKGDVYFADTNTGIYTVGSSTAPGSAVAVAAPGAKVLIPDGKGNFYYVGYNSGDTLGFYQIGSAAITAAASVGNPSSVANIYVLDDFGCEQSPALVFTYADPEFAGAAGGCRDMTFGGGSSFPETLTFTPTAAASGTVTTTQTTTDSYNGGTGTAQVSAVAATAQLITNFTGVTSPVAFGGGPYTIGATGGASGNPLIFTLDATSTAGAATLSGTTLTITGVGTVVIDINQAGTTTGTPLYSPGYLQVPIVVTQGAQVIQPPTLPKTIGFGASISLPTATGGASGNPVTYSLDASSTAGAATLSGSTLTATGLGTIVLDLNQAGNANYTAAPLVRASITVTVGTQVITISATPTSPTYPATSKITATGGASGNPVTIVLTSGGAVATLSGNTLTPTGTAFGPVVVTANQAGNADYTAATAATVTVTFAAAGAVATPTFTPASGGSLVLGTTNTVTIADSTAGAVIWYTTDGSNPLTSSTSIKYSGAITLATAGTVNLNAAATLLGDTPSAVATASYTVTAVAPTFTISASPGSAIITSGSPATITITVTPSAAFTSAITFACTGAPNVTCSFSPASITPPATVKTTLTVSEGTSAALHRGPNPFLPGGVTFAIALGFLGWKKRRKMLLALVLMASIISLVQLTGCGGKNGTTYSVGVTATGGGITQTLPLLITAK